MEGYPVILVLGESLPQGLYYLFGTLGVVRIRRDGGFNGTLDMNIPTPTMGAHQDHFRLGRL